MKNLQIGKSGIEVPFLGMGTWAIGGGAWWGDNDDSLSVKAIQTAVEQGIRWIDTAPIYGLYHSEEVVGEAMKHIDRDKVVLSTKCGLEWRHETPVLHKVVDGVTVYRDLSAQSIIEDVEDSLLTRRVEKQLLPTCKELGVSVQAYSPLEQGLLTGKVTMDTTYPEGSTRNSNPNFQPARRAQALAMLNNWQDLTEKYHCTMAQLVIALTARMVPGLFVLCGARTPEQVTDNAGAMHIHLDGADAVRMKWDVDSIS